MIQAHGPVSVKLFESIEGGLEMDVQTPLGAVTHHPTLEKIVQAAQGYGIQAEIKRGNVVMTLPWLRFKCSQ